jgi:hypothetical protein
MRWLTLFNRLGKQPIRNLRDHNVMLMDGDYIKDLELKFTENAIPYFIVKTDK